MAWSPRIGAVLLCGALVFAGLFLGAESQKEEFLRPDAAAPGGEGESPAAGTLIPLTAVPVALGAALGGALLSTRPWRPRLAGALLVFAGAWLGVQLVQGAWPAYDAFVEGRSASLSTNLLVVDEEAVPSLWVPVLAVVAGTLLALGAGVRLLARPPPGPPSPDGVLRRMAGAVALAVPFLAVASWGCVRLLVEAPEAEAGVPYLVVLPLFALASLGLVATLVWRLASFGAFVRDGRLAGAAEETWRGLGRAETALLGVLVGLAVLSSLLPAADSPDLQAGPTFGVSLRGHAQFLAALAVPLAPALLAYRAALASFARDRAHRPGPGAVRTPPAVALTAAASLLSVALAGLATFSTDHSLLPWLAAAVPLALAAWRVAAPAAAAAPLLVAAFVAWALGNGVSAAFDESTGDSVLRFATPPGVLALWRVLGAFLAVLAVARPAALLPPAARPRASMPAAAGLAVALALLALVELPLSAWVVTRDAGQSIGLGSLVASQEPPVRGLLHTVAALAAVGAAYLAARLWRPDWFGRRRHPAEAMVRAKAARAAPGP